MSSIEKNEKRETLADIVAEIRAYGAQPPPRLMWLEIADRIEAAWGRDEELAVEHATRHAEAVARDNCRDCVHNPNGKNYVPVGNAAAMREALEMIHDKVNGLDEECGVDPVEIRDIARTALAAPPRNCDEYDCKSDAEVGFVKQTGETDESPLYWQLFANWLFATAEERKGED